MVQEPAPCLPMEILEEIVAFHGMKVDGKPSATLLACLATSRQFRACALRYLCADVPVYLDRPDQLWRLRDCMISAEFCHCLTSVEIVFSSTPYPEAPRLNEENILPLIEILSRQASLRAVAFQARSWLWGHAVGELSWTKLPPKTRIWLRTLSQVPTVTRLAFRWFLDVPPEFFSQQPYKSITFADGHTSSSGPMAELNTTSLILETARFRNVALPILRHIKTRCHFEAYYHPTWDVIKQCCHTLETIQVQEYAGVIPTQIPQDIQLHKFPRLEEFTHSFDTSITSLDIHPILSKFFPPAQTTSMTSNLKKLSINLRITDGGQFDYSANNPWQEQLTTVAGSSVWADLDDILAKGLYFTTLKRVSIRLIFIKRNPEFFATLDNEHLAGSLVDSDALREKLRVIFLETFSASIKASIPLNIFVCLDVRS